MDQMLATAELVRLQYEFRGYIHLKLLPDAPSRRKWHVRSIWPTGSRLTSRRRLPNDWPPWRRRSRWSELLAPLRTAAELIRQDRQAQGRGESSRSGGHGWA